MAARLHTGADDCECARVWQREEVSGDGGDRGGSRLGDVSAVEESEQRTGVRIE
jgi:hypothetical protein